MNRLQMIKLTKKKDNTKILVNTNYIIHISNYKTGSKIYTKGSPVTILEVKESVEDIENKLSVL